MRAFILVSASTSSFVVAPASYASRTRKTDLSTPASLRIPSEDAVPGVADRVLHGLARVVVVDLPAGSGHGECARARVVAKAIDQLRGELLLELGAPCDVRREALDPNATLVFVRVEGSNRRARLFAQRTVSRPSVAFTLRYLIA